MKLSTLLNDLDYEIEGETKDKEIEALAYHSDKAKEGSIFFAVEGSDTDGNLYIPDAVAKGCSVIVAGENCKDLRGIYNKAADCLTVIKVKDVRAAMAEIAARFYHEPSKELLTIGITGTKGKTSTAYMIWKIMEEAGIKTGIIGTVFTGFEGNLRESANTTPQSADIHRSLREMKDSGCTAAVIEVSSQGLMQKRTDFIEFDIGIFTNLSPDHIGEREHKSYSEYRYWKSRLFNQCRIALMNIDDKECYFMAENSSAEKIFFYGRDEKADFSIDKVNLWSEGGSLGVKYNLAAPDFYTGEAEVLTRLPGEFNAYNSAAAAAACTILNIPLEKILCTLKSIKIPGRAETVNVSDDFTVMVDYAHNGVALKSLLESLKKYNPKRLITVFGCGGNRDRNRRKEMGRAASELSDVIIVTSDNPRNEHPMKIIDDITENISPHREVMVIPDRREAIGKALELGAKNDIIIIAGKGHETYQIIGDETRHFDDREEILSYRKES